jgi:Mg2+/Co2+ transporter CorC
LFERKEGNGGAFGTLFDDDDVGTGGGLVVKLKIRNMFLIL